MQAFFLKKNASKPIPLVYENLRTANGRKRLVDKVELIASKISASDSEKKILKSLDALNKEVRESITKTNNATNAQIKAEVQAAADKAEKHNSANVEVNAKKN